MKKIINLLSVMAISGTAIPTTIAANPYQKQENKLEISESNYSQTNNLKELNKNEKEKNKIYASNNSATIGAKNKKIDPTKPLIILKDITKKYKNDYYAKKEIEFFNNRLFYKFNMHFVDDKKWGTMSSDSLKHCSQTTIIQDWTKYAKNWKEFEKKFPKIEFIGLRAQLGGMGDDEPIKEFKMPSKLNSPVRLMNYKYPKNGSWCFCCQGSYIDVELFLAEKQLKIRHIYNFSSSNCLYRTWGTLKYDAIRLVGKVDVNPLFLEFARVVKQFDIWAKAREAELQLKRNKKKYSKKDRAILSAEEESFKEDFKLRVIEIQHSYIQDLMLLNHNNQIENLKAEIDEINSRLNKLEHKKTCVDSIFDSYKKSIITSATSGALNSGGLSKIKENSDSPLEVIIRESAQAFATGFLTGGVSGAKGIAVNIIACLAESLF